MTENKSKTLKYISLVTLTFQNAILGLSMRYSRTRSGDLFFSSTGKLSIVDLFNAFHEHLPDALTHSFQPSSCQKP